ncbi:MAG: hypothetical protein L0216_10190 [Planctomycetales bacterium]|nr:hypothetical protein [Planctomycetales bacterium]
MKVGDSWNWKGDILFIRGGENVLGTFTLKEIATENGEVCARVTGTAKGLPGGEKSKFSCEVLFSLSRKIPIRSRLDLEVPGRTIKLETSLAPDEPSEPSREATK